ATYALSRFASVWHATAWRPSSSRAASLAHLHAVLLGQILGCQRRSESPVHVLAQDLDRSLFHLHRKLSVRWAPAPGVNYRLVATLFQAPQHASHLPLADTDSAAASFCVISFFLAFFSATSRSRSFCVIRSPFPTPQPAPVNRTF